MKKEINKNKMYIFLEEDAVNSKYYELEISYNYNSNNILYKNVLLNEVEKKDFYKTRSFMIYEDSITTVIEKVNRKSQKKLEDLINNYNNNILLNDINDLKVNYYKNNNDEKMQFLNKIINIIKMEEAL